MKLFFFNYVWKLYRFKEYKNIFKQKERPSFYSYWGSIRDLATWSTFFLKKVARGGEQTRVLSIQFIFSFSPFYRWATAAPDQRFTPVEMLKMFVITWPVRTNGKMGDWTMECY
jgi:hypothetical protein